MKKLIIHCSDSPHDHHGLEAIRQWHIERGWSDIGYNYVIERSGDLKKGRSESILGAHTLGHNKDIGLCLCGNSGKFRNKQIETLTKFIIDNNERILSIHQHSEFSDTKPHCAGLSDKMMQYLNSLV